MKTVLDLVGEFAALNDGKVRAGGWLPPEFETRWSELKGFYDLLMAQNGLTRRPVTNPFTAKDIKSRVPDRQRLRVPADLYVVLKFQEEFLPGQVMNLSRGGVFLASQRVFPVSAELVLFLANPFGGQVGLFETDGEVVWSTEQGIAGSEVPHGMGVRFGKDDAQGLINRQLDSIVVETLERHLSGVDSNAITPDFVERECLVL
jgi:Tfp pilus assembly protein PilZ